MVVDVDARATAEAPVPKRTRRLGRRAIAGLALAALVLVGWAAWARVSATAVGGVRVIYDAQPIVCEGSEVGVRPSAENPELLQPVVSLADGMRCELRIQVVNDSWSEVTVTTVGLEGLSSPNPLALEPAFVNPNGQERTDDRQTAFFEITGGIVVPAGGSATFTAVIDYGGGAEMVTCASQGWGVAVVTVTALGATREVRPAAEDVIWFQEGSLTSCS